ncbi:MAG: xanthine dehydrogenase family protein molybdopterin-binding subunit [Thermoanaerobaculia bacterium]|nr:xanthine dehydrogenase family protein molybdopterin-binding subunit [Thermoanaerobaculia bacterium]
MTGPCSFMTQAIATAATTATTRENPALPAWEKTNVVGAAVPRVDAHERVSGTAVYTRDLALPGMLHCAIVRSPHAHARVKRIDASRALAMPGVHAVITCDSPEASIPWYFGAKGALSRLLDPECRYEGDEVAALVAETPLQAADAARAVVVEYEILPFVVDYERALRPDAPKVHPFGNQLGEPRVTERGDLASGFAAADVTVEREFHTSCELHTPMETHCSVAQWDGGSLQVWDSTQGVYAIRRGLAQALQLPLASVRVSSRFMGGGFGSKLELGKYTVLAAILARTTGRPVKAALSREETMLCAGNRPANTISIKAGARKDGKLTAFDAKLLGGVGAFPAAATSGYLVLDLYTCANVRVEETAALMNAGQARAFRAPGFPQAAWALEQVIDELAERLGLDPVAMRLKNVPTLSQMRAGQPYTSTGLADCLKNGSAGFGWAAARKRARGRGHVRRGIGVAAGMWGYGGDPTATAIVKLYADGSANVNSGAADIGTGTRTILAQVVAEELGVPIAKIQVEMADTATTQFAPSSGGSQTVLVNMPAARSAAVAVKNELLSLAAAELGKDVKDLSLRDGAIEIAGDAKSVPLAQLKSLAQRQQLVGVGKREPHPEGKVALPFAAHFAEVEVNTRTGAVKVVKYLAAQDSGRVMNALTYENQVLGGVTMGIGFGLTERRMLDRNTGKLVTGAWHDYKIPTALDFPAEFTCLPVDPRDAECNSVGAKGLGEPATVPAAAAIANAVRDAIGVRIFDAPITANAIVTALARTRS